MASLTEHTFTLPAISAGVPAVQIHAYLHRPIASSSSRPTILFLPYWGGTARMFHPLQSIVSRTNPDTTTISISYPGTGQSSYDPPDSEDANPVVTSPIQDLTSQILALIHLLVERDLLSPTTGILLCGHSMGGKIALSLLPHLSHLAIPVRSALLIAPAPPGPRILPPDVREGQIHAYDTAENAEFAVRNVLSHRELSDDVLTELVEDAVGMSTRAKRGWIEFGMGEDVRPALKAMVETDRGKDTRIAILVGREDRVEAVERVEKETVEVLRGMGFNGVSLKLVEECGHLMPIEDTSEVFEELQRLLE